MVRDGEDLTVAQLQQFVGERLARFKVPTLVSIVHEQLPRNASGKIQKRDLRDAVITGAGSES
jgi:acyl-CoA synthetase (AMP-forming)/AMP-acid ligase II